MRSNGSGSIYIVCIHWIYSMAMDERNVRNANRYAQLVQYKSSVGNMWYPFRARTIKRWVAHTLGHSQPARVFRIGSDRHTLLPLSHLLFLFNKQTDELLTQNATICTVPRASCVCKESSQSWKCDEVSIPLNWSPFFPVGFWLHRTVVNALIPIREGIDSCSDSARNKDTTTSACWHKYVGGTFTSSIHIQKVLWLTSMFIAYNNMNVIVLRAQHSHCSWHKSHAGNGHRKSIFVFETKITCCIVYRLP